MFSIEEFYFTTLRPSASTRMFCSLWQDISKSSLTKKAKRIVYDKRVDAFESSLKTIQVKSDLRRAILLN